jgi:NADH:ubiquinone reductase (H+-translocating)
MPTRVVCLGGGHCAAIIAKNFRKAIRRSLIDATFVDRDNFTVFHGFIPEMLCAKVQPSQLASPARRIFPPAHFHNAEIESIDLDAHTVITSRKLDGRQYVLPYDHLILAIGSIDDLSRYAGTAEHAQRLKTYSDCLKCRSHIINMLEMAAIENDPMERRRLLTFVVVGGNFGGTEVATELQDYLHSLTRREYSDIRPEEIKVILVHSGSRILPELRQHHEPLIVWAERFLATSGVEFRFDTRVTAATPEEVVLSTGERIPARTVISCSGTAQSPLLDGLELPRDDRGRIRVDENLRVLGRANVWAGGDCAAVPHPNGGICPQLAIFAETQGRQIARNVVALADGKPLKPYRFTGLGDACSLGRRRAVGHLKGIPLKGRFAWVAWRFMLLRFVPALDRKIRLVIDWALWPIFGRDVVNFRMDDSFGVRRQHYEPGQEIIREGDIGRYLYVISEGEVEVLRTTASGPEILATLGRGQHFGEVAVFNNVRRTASVRARTQVELLSIGHQESLALSVIAPFADVVTKTPTAVVVPAAASAGEFETPPISNAVPVARRAERG